MTLDKRYEKACLQILRKDDLTISTEIEKELEQKKLTAQFIEDKSGAIYLKIYGTKHFMLTDIVPLLKNIGLAVLSEISYEIPVKGKKLFISRYQIDNDLKVNIKEAQDNILKLIEIMLCNPVMKNRPLLQFTLLQNLSPRDLELIFAFVDFENQLVAAFNKTTIAKVLVKHHAIVKVMLNLFYAKFDPLAKKRKMVIAEASKQIETMLHDVTHITEDKVLCLLHEMIKATVRTNFFLGKETIAFKTLTNQCSDYLLGLQPKIETFVHHYNLSGVHMRMDPVSRGGIRWSDRYEDFRVEIRDLMLTQEGKNAIIIPSGAKGGFVINLPKEEITHTIFRHCYELFIDALLDLVDNLEDKNIISNPKIIHYDENDTYFVVAADKGTSNMSDVANALAIKKGFWMQDAFASGGSHGYSHKALGITAKGALRSVERYFIEQNINIHENPVSVIGIGSMNGDVFGNGMLYSQNFKLIAAISHNEIFIDPNPDTDIAFLERKRLFESESKGGWSYYDPKKISEGGGIFSRDDKAIPVSNQMQKLLRTTRQNMSGEELVKAVLKIKADMLFNGGVGTYVKASDESNLDVGDKANEPVRIDAADLQVSAVCEGGNLGFTLPARIEFAKKGGFINLDAIDNSAGVNTSDYEVNLKITLQALIKRGEMDPQSRDETLQHQVDTITSRVLWVNYHQSLAISLDKKRSKENLQPFLRTISILERELKVFERKQFHIPKDEKIDKILDRNGEIVRPILSTLLSYTKIFLKKVLKKSDFINSAFAQRYLLKYFPKTFTTLYEDEIFKHPLKKEIAATLIANRIINNAGVTFISDYDTLGTDKFILKVKSYLLCNQLFGANDIRYEIFRRDYKLDPKTQYDLLQAIEETLQFSVEWILRHLNKDQIHAPTLLNYKNELSSLLESEKDHVSKPITDQDSKINSFFYHLPYMKFTIAAIILHEKNHRRFDETLRLIHTIIERLYINEIMHSLQTYHPISENEEIIKKQLESFIEFCVIYLAEKTIHYQRKEETLEEALTSLLQSCDSYAALQNNFEKMKDNITMKNLEEASILVNTLVQMTLENPV